MIEEKGRIIIIDDFARNIQVVASILRDEGYRVAYAQNGPDGLVLLRESHFDLVLLDVMMPDMDGYEVCRHIREDPQILNVPVIFITAKGEPGDIVKGLEHGAVDYISKPFNPAELVYRVGIHIELKQSRDKLKELNNMKDRFNSIMVHDIKSAFHTIMGLTEVLQARYHTSSEEQNLEYIETIYNSSHRLYVLLENILEWSKLQMGHVSWWPKNIPVKKLCVETMSMFGENASQKNVTLECLIENEHVVYADENMVRSILRNLLSNAVKFTGSGGIVTIGGENTPDMFRISITDTGTGISPEVQESLFKFAETGTMPGTALERGTGIGLILTREQVNMNGGEIAVETVPGKGTTVSFTLPEKSIGGEAFSPDLEEGASKEKRPHRVLLLDNDKKRPQTCDIILKGRNFHVDEVASHHEIQPALDVIQYDMILVVESDERLACLEAITEIKKSDLLQGSHTTIIALCSGYESSETLKQAGVDDIIYFKECSDGDRTGKRLLYWIKKRGKRGG